MHRLLGRLLTGGLSDWLTLAGVLLVIYRARPRRLLPDTDGRTGLGRRVLGCTVEHLTPTTGGCACVQVKKRNQRAAIPVASTSTATQNTWGICTPPGQPLSHSIVVRGGAVELVETLEPLHELEVVLVLGSDELLDLDILHASHVRST